MIAPSDCDTEGLSAEHHHDSDPSNVDNTETDWEAQEVYESSNIGPTSDTAINDALHDFQGRSDLLLEKYVQKVRRTCI